jgi:hypothetical protein
MWPQRRGTPPGDIEMTTETTTLEPEPTSVVHRQKDGRDLYCWRVRDTNGGIWYPSDEAMDDIISVGDDQAKQADRAVEICTEQPERGEWHQ